jgi:small subunit ribosomal protein S3
MAVGETAGQARPRRVISAGGGRRRPEAEPVPVERVAASDEVVEDTRPVLREADPELERLLAEEEEIERRTRQHHETPHFRGDED